MSEEIFKYNQYFNYEGDPSSYQINIPNGGSSSAPPAAASLAAGMNTTQLAQLGLNAATGGTAQAVMGGLQAVYGLTQLPKARAEFERAKAAAPSLETPSQFYENYKNAYDATLAKMQSDAIQANLATSVQALQGAGGRALVGGLSQATAQTQNAQNQMLNQERQMRLQAGAELARAEERSLARQEARNQQEQAYANQAYQAALSNIGGGLAAAGEGLMYSGGLKGMGIGGDGQLAEKAGKLADKAGAAIQEGASIVGDKAKQGVNYLKERYANTQNSVSPYADVPQRQFTEQEEKMIKEAQAGMDAGMFSMNPVRNAPAPIISPDPTFNDYRNYLRFQDWRAKQKYVANPFQLKGFKSGGMMTNGSFNHNTNPIDIVQDGMVVGEMTGGEYIINPTQAAKIAEQSSYARNLFKRFEKNAKNNQ